MLRVYDKMLGFWKRICDKIWESLSLKFSKPPSIHRRFPFQGFSHRRHADSNFSSGVND